jgi:pimeloyl-ACP methyl ester carboxylesterase
VPYMQVNDMRLYYEEHGPADGQPLLLMHGGGSALDDAGGGWVDLAPSFAERYRVILMDHRGHGRTDNPAGQLTYEMLGNDTVAFIEQLGRGPVHLAGMSDGGIVALDMGIRRPDLIRTLIPLGANYCVDELVLSDVGQISAEALERDHPEQAAAAAACHDRGKQPGYWKTLLPLVSHNAATNPSWTEADLQRIHNPTLLIAGENDNFANTEQMIGMKRNIPNAEWLIINHAGHTVQHTHPEIVGPRILDFLARHA